MILQASPDVETLLRNDMAKVLAELLDAAAIAGTGAANQPRGILNTAGISTVAVGTNGGPLTYALIADLVGKVEDANGVGGFMGFLTNSLVRRQLVKVVETTGAPIGLPVLFQQGTTAFSNLGSIRKCGVTRTMDHRQCGHLAFFGLLGREHPRLPDGP